MEILEPLFIARTPIAEVAVAILGHLRIAGILLALDMIFAGITSIVGWMNPLTPGTRFEFLFGCWMLWVFLYPLG